MTRVYELELPWPPSENSYRRTPKGATSPIISAAGRKYRETVAGILHRLKLAPLSGKLAVTIDAYPPDRRKHDLDNLLKAPLDALQHGGLYADDGDIDDLHIRRRCVTTGGMLIVTIGQKE